ncbi:MAG: GGDEF domain-containing protein [Gammaproteobacteria bacterium]|nr:GGDEF domain-containing protein [Gammaproteobacteria bacterium]
MQNNKEGSSTEPKMDTVATDLKTDEHPTRLLQKIELHLLDKDTLPEIFIFLLQELKTFLNIEVISLGLLDSEGLMRTLLRCFDHPAESFPNLVFMEDKDMLLSIHSHPWEPCFTTFLGKEYTLFASRENSEEGSIMMLPLIRRQSIIGTLNLGSYHPHPFDRMFSTDFIERLTRMISVCLGEATSRGQVKWLCLTDHLTGIYNRRCFELRLQEEISKAKRRKTHLSCAFLDIDHFKLINDRFGHGIGDKVLQHVVGLIRGELRQSDFFARYGGDEFTLLLPETSSGHAFLVAERIREKVATTVLPFEVLPSMTLSAGITTFAPLSSSPPPLPEQLVQQADEALYAAKAVGRNRVMNYTL